MIEAGTLTIAGPFLDDGEIRGIYIFKVETIEEAEKLTNTDPAIQQGVLAIKLHEFYDSAGLMAVYKLHNTLAKNSFTESKNWIQLIKNQILKYCMPMDRNSLFPSKPW